MYKHLFTLITITTFAPHVSAQVSKRKRIPMDPNGALVFGQASTPTPKPHSQGLVPVPNSLPTPVAPETPLPGFTPTENQPFQTAPRPSLTPLEIQASIYSVAGLPEVATIGTFTIPTGGSVNVADALLFIQTGSPVEVNIQVMPIGGNLKPLTVSLHFPTGWGTLPIPSEFAGQIATFKTNRPVCFYIPKVADGVMFGTDVSRCLRQVVAPKTSDRRVQMLSRPNLRLQLMPSNPQAVSESPDTKDYWETFLKRVSTLQ